MSRASTSPTKRWRRHYGVAVVPARPRKPRDKAKVEVGVQIAERWILAALRKQTFFSLGEVSLAIARLLTRLNERPFRKREGSRKSLFESAGPAFAAVAARRTLSSTANGRRRA